MTSLPFLTCTSLSLVAVLISLVSAPMCAHLMRPQFVTFGDSITQRGFSAGWTSLLADAYQRRADVINRGYSGYNSRWALQLLDHVFPQPTAALPPPRLATVFFGANDAALPDRGS
jgi:lysophospholipase L1-like esterase